MARSRRSPDPRARRRRIIAGGATGFIVTFAFVAANAIWYQPHAHRSPLLATRMPAPAAEGAAGEAEQVTIIRLEREEAQAEVQTPPPQRRDPAPQAETTAQAGPATQGDPAVREVQRVMSGLGIYGGAVDGLKGPVTRAAVRSYQETVGLPPTGEIDEALLARLGLAEPQVPTPAARNDVPRDAVQTASVAPPTQDATLMRVQAGLKAFGHDGLAIDGMMGPRTRDAIREFQSLFGLPETGEADAATYAKMREIGLAE